jgi:hypothetical protein
MESISKVFKYPIRVDDEQELRLAAGSRILSVIEQHDQICIYAITPLYGEIPADNDPLKTITIRMVGTGHTIKFDLNSYTFLGTVKLHEGALVFHVFYRDWGYSG